MSLALSSIIPLSFLLTAVVDDLLFKKFHNWLFITLSLVGFSYTLFFTDMTSMDIFGGFLIGGLLMLPLVLIGAIGAGDMKFLMCFGIVMGITATIEIFIQALLWGGLIGLLQALFAGKIRMLLSNLLGFAYKLRPAQTNNIPYTVAILLGWVSYSIYGGLIW